MTNRTAGPTPWLTAAAFAGVGLLHFVRPKKFDSIVPPWVEEKLGMSPREATLVSGAAEIAGGLGMLHPRTRPAARLGLLALLAAVFPVHIYMLREPERFSVPKWALWVRPFLQPLIARQVWQAGRGR